MPASLSGGCYVACIGDTLKPGYKDFFGRYRKGSNEKYPDYDMWKERENEWARGYIEKSMDAVKAEISCGLFPGAWIKPEVYRREVDELKIESETQVDDVKEELEGQGRWGGQSPPPWGGGHAVDTYRCGSRWITGNGDPHSTRAADTSR